MPRTRSLAWSELKIGVLTIIAVTVSSLIIFSVTGSKGFFWQRYPLKARFTDVTGLMPGAPVRVAGVTVGTVNTMKFVGEQVEVSFDVNERNRPLITSKSIAKLGSVSLLGQSAVDITPGPGGTPIPDWGYVQMGRPAVALADMTEAANQGLNAATAMVQDIRAGRGTVGKLMTDDQLYVELNRFLAAAGDLTDGIKQGRGTLGQLMTDPDAARSLEASLKNIEQLTRRISEGQGSLGALLKDDAFSKSLTSATTNLDALAAKINRGEGTAGKLMTDPALFDRLNSVTTRLDTLVTQLNDGQGTAGQLLKDKQLYENMNGAVGDLRSLVADIRKDPRKFLNIKVSVF